MNFEGGDIIYATLVIGLAIFGYRVIRSVTMGLLSKVVVTGGGLALLLDFHSKFGWKLDTAYDWLWLIATPDSALIAGIVTGLALTLRDRYAPMLSEAGFLVQRMKKSAEVDLVRQRQDIEADLTRQHREAAERLEREKAEAREDIEKEQEQARHERERAERRDPYEVLGVSRDATQADIKKRYRELVAQYHPDKATQTTPEIQKMAEERVKEINAAYEALLKGQ